MKHFIIADMDNTLVIPDECGDSLWDAVLTPGTMVQPEAAA